MSIQVELPVLESVEKKGKIHINLYILEKYSVYSEGLFYGVRALVNQGLQHLSETSYH